MNTKNATDSVMRSASEVSQKPAPLLIADTLPELLPERLEPMQLSLIADVSKPDPILSDPEFVLDVANDSVISIKSKRKMKFLLGLDYTPQGSSYHYAKTRGMMITAHRHFRNSTEKTKRVRPALTIITVLE